MKVSDANFETIAMAANLAKQYGDTNLAEELDILARKINAEITRDEYRQRARNSWTAPSKPVSWKEMPSVLIDV